MGKKYGCNYIQDLINTDRIYGITDHELLHVIILTCTSQEFNNIKKPDLSGVCFDNIDVRSFDFTGCKGVKINPREVLGRSLENTKLNGVEIIGSFDGVDIECTDFTGSKGAKINPQTIEVKNLRGTELSGVEIIGSFDGVNIERTNFTGSKGAKIDPQTIRNKNLSGITLSDAEIIGPFDGVDIRFTDFTGSKGAKIDPQTVRYRSLRNTKLSGVEIIGFLDGVDMSFTDFTNLTGGSSFAKMELRKYNALKQIKQIILNEIETNSSNLEQIKTLKKSKVRLRKIKNKK